MTTPDLSEFRTNIRTKPCIVSRWSEKLSSDDQAKFQAALEAFDISTSAIYRWAEQRDADFRLNSVQLHRRGNCACRRI